MNQTPSGSADGKRITVSVVVPVLNEVRLRHAIESVLSQVYAPRPELVVVDGGSTDRTLDVIAEYRDRISILVQEPDGGIFDGINKGNRLASGDVIAFLGADDRYVDPWALSDAMKPFADDRLDICYGDAVFVNGDGRIVRQWKTGRCSSFKLCSGWQPPHAGVFMRRRVVERFGPFDTNYPISADYCFFLQVMTDDQIKAKYIGRTIAKIASGGTSSAFVKGNVEVARMIWRRRLFGACLAPLLKPARKLLQCWPMLRFRAWAPSTGPTTSASSGAAASIHEPGPRLPLRQDRSRDGVDAGFDASLTTSLPHGLAPSRPGTASTGSTQPPPTPVGARRFKSAGRASAPRKFTRGRP